MPVFNSEKLVTLYKAKVWLQIILSYMFIFAIIATLICAYLQSVNTIVISASLIIGGVYGFYMAEKIRTNLGLIAHQAKLEHQQRLFN